MLPELSHRLSSGKIAVHLIGGVNICVLKHVHRNKLLSKQALPPFNAISELEGYATEISLAASGCWRSISHRHRASIDPAS